MCVYVCIYIYIYIYDISSLAPNNTSNWQMRFNSAFKGLNQSTLHHTIVYRVSIFNPLYTFACGRSPAEILGSNPTGGMDICLL